MVIRMGDGRRVRWSREAFVHLGAAIAGPTVGVLLLGTTAPVLIWRSGALTVSLSLVGAALVLLARLGRSEWRRQRPPLRAYAGVVGRSVGALVLVVLATA